MNWSTLFGDIVRLDGKALMGKAARRLRVLLRPIASRLRIRYDLFMAFRVEQGLGTFIARHIP